MKKYTQPTVEITAFDFEDIMDTSSGTLGGGKYSASATEFEAVKPDNMVIVEW